MAKRKASMELEVDLEPQQEEFVEIIPLGAGQEVGRSCIILQYMGRKVMLDCGIHPGHSGLASLPFLDEVDLDTIDVALITHFHLDHCAAVPYLIGKTNFKGRLIMTHPTKAICYTLLRDFVKVSAGSADEALYSEEDLEAAMNRCEVLDFDQTLDIDGIQVTPYRAGHVLGAAMFMVQIAGMRALYTGDYSRVADRHLSAADIPPVRPHIVIVESTYGVSRHLPKEVREKHFMDKIHSTVLAGGRVLLPIVALGRAQELLLMLDEYWERNPALQGVPIYQASGLARKALSVFQTYIEMMNEDIKTAFAVRNPFNFRHVTHLKGASHFDDSGPCVMMATPSMLQSGMSRDLFEAWCENPANAVIIADFAVQGTLAREIINNPSHIITKAGVRVPLRASVEHISFSAHADYEQTSGFLDTLQPPHVVLVHGEAGEMMRLKQALERAALQQKIARTVYNPKVVQSVQIPHRPERTAVVVGRLAEKVPHAGQMLRGVLVRRGTELDNLMAPDDLPAFTKLHTGRVTHKQAVALACSFSDLRLALEVMFEGVEGAGHLPVTTGLASPSHTTTAKAAPTPSGQENADLEQQQPQKQQEQAISIGGVVTVRYRPGNTAAGYESHVVLEWEGGVVGDMVADAVVAVILQAAGEPPAAAAAEQARRKALAAGDAEGVQAAELDIMAALLRAQFGVVQVDAEEHVLRLELDGQPIVVDAVSGKVVCEADKLRERLEKAMLRVKEALRPCILEVAE